MQKMGGLSRNDDIRRCVGKLVEKQNLEIFSDIFCNAGLHSLFFIWLKTVDFIKDFHTITVICSPGNMTSEIE